MHQGTVNNHLEPCVNLTVLGNGRAELDLEFVIDTGCTEEMILPQYIISRLNLTRINDVILALGDGTAGYFASYIGWIQWHGQPREVTVRSMGYEPLIGVSLLRGSNLSFDAIPGGAVTISELLRSASPTPC